MFGCKFQVPSKLPMTLLPLLVPRLLQPPQVLELLLPRPEPYKLLLEVRLKVDRRRHLDLDYTEDVLEDKGPYICQHSQVPTL